MTDSRPTEHGVEIGLTDAMKQFFSMKKELTHLIGKTGIRPYSPLGLDTLLVDYLSIWRK